MRPAARFLRGVLPVLAALFLFDPAPADAGRAVVTASTLNVRAAPSTQARVIAQLPRGATVITVTSDGAWVQVGFRSGSDARVGWVAGRHLSGRGGAGVRRSDRPACEEDEAEARLVSAEADDLDCDRAISGEGYGACEVEIEVEAARSCRTGEDLDVGVRCEIVLTGYEGRGDRFGSSYDDDDSVYFEIDAGDETAWADMEIEVDVEPISGVTTRVEGDELDCRAFVD